MRPAIGAVLALLALRPELARAADPTPPEPREGRARSFVAFAAGAAVGLAAHESGHLAFDVAFDAHPGVKHVHFGAIPFFAITHDPGLSPRREFTIASAGFWVQHAGSEWILTRRPDLRHEHAPFTKGVLAFDIFTSVGYAAAAFTHAGPPERDPRGMAVSLGVDEPWVGAMILAPALLDSYRYLHPRSGWAKWTSRGCKAALVLLVLK